MSTVYGFNKKNDIKRLLRMLDKFEGSQGKLIGAKSSVRKEAKHAKILTVFNNTEDADNDDKEATAVEAVWDKEIFDFVEVTVNPVTYDAEALDSADATVYSVTNITSKSKMTVGNVVLLQHYPHLSETSDWLVVETGGGNAGTRVFIIVTAVISAAEYTGNVVISPDDSEIVDTAVTIKIYGGLFNALEVGYAAFADATVDTEGVKTYYFDGAVLG